MCVPTAWWNWIPEMLAERPKSLRAGVGLIVDLVRDQGVQDWC